LLKDHPGNRRIQRGAGEAAQTLVRETILQLIVSERFRLDDVSGDLTPLHIRAVAIANVKVLAHRNGLARTRRGAAHWHRGRTKAKTSMDDRTMEAVSKATTVDKVSDGKPFTLDGERSRRNRSGRTDRAAL
jgi:hypothetical protein